MPRMEATRRAQEYDAMGVAGWMKQPVFWNLNREMQDLLDVEFEREVSAKKARVEVVEEEDLGGMFPLFFFSLRFGTVNVMLRLSVL